MATYKVLQDIEAEDKLLGPLTLRQFIYALVAAFCLYLSFISVAKHAAFLLVLFLPPAIFCGFFAFPFGQDQPTEVWALAKIRFFFKPRRRIWDQSGIKELVTITVPKKLERIFTNGLTQTEVSSRLHALADTIDSRGWAVKNVNVNLYAQPGPLTADSSSDRLIDMASMPQVVPDYDIQAADDILDERSNPVAQQFDQMINASTSAHRKQLIDELNDVRTGQPAPSLPAVPLAQPTADHWFAPLDGPPAGSQLVGQIVTPGAADQASDAIVTPEEQAVIDNAKAHNNSRDLSYSHLHTIQPLGDNAATGGPAVNDNQAVPIVQLPLAAIPDPASPASPDPAILTLATNNDLNVATLAREAHKSQHRDDPPQDEVVISLR